MGLIRAIFYLVILAVIVGFSYWLYATYTIAPEPYWAQINRLMPDPLRRYSCDRVRARVQATPLATCDGY